MTVRAWLTISAVVLVVLGAAAAWRFLQPVEPPAVLARAGDVRLEGTFDGGCWPQRGDELRCHEAERAAAETARVAGDGSFSIVVAFPAQPDEGYVQIGERGGRRLQRAEWTRRLPYRLAPGLYELVAEARYGAGAYVRYRFPFRVG